MPEADHQGEPRYTVAHSSAFDAATQAVWGRDCWYLLHSDEVVWSDRMEPEDAILPRDLSDLVDVLNEQAADAARWAAAYRGEDPGEGATPEQVELYWSRRPLPEGWAADSSATVWEVCHYHRFRRFPTRAEACRHAWAQEEGR